MCEKLDLIMSEPSDIHKTMNYVYNRLSHPEFQRYGLYVEVIVWALKAMKADPSLSVEQALEEGCREWDI